MRRFGSGLFKDTAPADQPENTYRYAMNAVLNRTLLCIMNEPSNEEDALMPALSRVCGSIPLTDGRVVLFLDKAGDSEIGVYISGSYSTVLSLPVVSGTDTDLGFDPSYPVTGTSKVQSDGDVIVYFTDDLNPPRSLNLTRQLLSPEDTIYGKSPATSPDRHFINRLNLFPHAGPVPHVTLKDVMSGGGCKTGSYQLCIGYEDRDLTATDYVSISNPVPIVDEPEGVTPIEAYDGAPAGTVSGKSIVWTLSNINTDMRYLTLAVVQRVGGVDSVLRLPRKEITSSQMEVAFTGEEASETDTTDVLEPMSEYSTAKTMEQLDSTLYVGNLTSGIDLGYQRYANRISTEAVTHTFPRFDPFSVSDSFLTKRKSQNGDRSQGYRDPKNIERYRSFMRDEVYALYISFILPSGKMSYAYHIPGRAPLTAVPVTDIEYTDPQTATVDEDMQLLWNTNDWHMIGLTGQTDPKGFFYQWFDFSHLTSLGSRNMNYWHNLHERYPLTSDFQTVDASNPGVVTEDLRGKNVRLHRFPGNRNPDMTTVKGTSADSFSTFQSRTKVLVHWYWFGTLENEASLPTDVAQPVLAGAYPTEDWVGAQAMQADMGNNMCTGCIGNLSTPSSTSCYPPTNTILLTPGFYAVFGCVPDAATDIEFIYDTQIQEGNQVMVGWGNVTYGCNFIAPGYVTAVSGTDVTLSTSQTGNDNWPAPATAARGGWVMWVECQEVLDTTASNDLTHEVQALGFRLSDLKIPKSIADKVQGFRIYYAKRTHDNRTILGQAPIHPMGDRWKMDLSGCDGGGTSTGLLDYLIPGGQPAPQDPSFYPTSVSFHDFYLLNRTPSLAQATHLRLQYTLRMFNFKGHVEYNRDAQRTDISDPDNKIYSCWKPQVITSFHLSGAHDRIADSTSRLNWLLVDKSRTYLYGNTILEASHLGFERPIYNIGGNTRIALRTQRVLPYLPCGASADWRSIRSDYSTVGFSEYTEDPTTDSKNSCMLYMANLNAFKTDVYSPIDRQDLVWTGYEVLGSDMDDFVVDDDGNPIGAGTFETEDIFGGDTYICRYGYRMTQREEVNRVPYTYPNTGSIDHKSVIMTVVECSDNINLRHIETNGEPYFPGDSLKGVLRPKADVDLTYNPDIATGKMRYNEDYSAVNDLRAILPYPFHLEQPLSHPTRVIRSDRTSSSSLVDNYRYFRADQAKELNNRYGELWKISAMGNLLLFHMEDALFITKGKQRMNVSEGQPAYIGSGDLFEQEPDVVEQTDGGYLGTRSQQTAIVTPEGYFFVDNLEKRIFLVRDKAEDLSSYRYGMSLWFRQNLPFELEEFGVRPYDSPVIGTGMIAAWDPKFRRILLTKRDLRPTQAFRDAWLGVFSRMSELKWSTLSGIATVHNRLWYRTGQTPGTEWTELVPTEDSTWVPGRTPLFTRTGWTISFVPEKGDQAGYWESFHDYVPYHWSLTGTDLLSFSDADTDVRRRIWKHNANGFGMYYGVQYPWTVETVETVKRDSIFFNLGLYTEVGQERSNRLGLTSYIAWTSDHMTSETELEYLVNMRRVGSEWHINELRDMTLQQTSTSPYYTGPFTGGVYNIPGLPVTGAFNTGSQVRIQQPMFLVDGMYETQDVTTLDTTKPWYLQSKMSGKYLGIRLFNDNLNGDQVNLYSVNSDSRIMQR